MTHQASDLHAFTFSSSSCHFIHCNFCCNCNLVIIYACRDFEVVGHFLPVVLNLPSSCHVAVRHTSIKLVGELADWIEKHPEYLGRYTAENLVWIKHNSLGVSLNHGWERFLRYWLAVGLCEPPKPVGASIALELYLAISMWTNISARSIVHMPHLVCLHTRTCDFT